MVPELDRLTSSEVELVYKSPMLVCILIAGADGRIDKKEIRGAIEFAEMKQQTSLSSVSVLFHEVAKDFEDKVKILIQQYPYELTQRNPLIVEDLAGLNQIWPKIDPNFARELYLSLLRIAEKIASSSGGLLGYKTIGNEEAKFIKLPMIKNPSGGHA
jgi:hypothetical protein